MKSEKLVRAAFAFYYGPYDDEPASPCYIVMESNHPRLPLYGNVDGEALLECGVGLPITPTYATWLKMGSPVYRGEAVRR